jgi:uncharacterized membrane protein YphA (DoxX/SURF4 family)
VTALTAQVSHRLDRWQRQLPWVATVIRLLLAWVFFTSGWPKFVDSAGTIRSVRAFQLVPEVFVPAFGYALPVVELLLGALLLVGLLTRVSAAVTAVLMVMFLFGIAMAWGRGLSIDCGCFGSGDVVKDAVAGYIRDILRDLGFLVLAALLWLRPRSALSLDGLLGLTPVEDRTVTAGP